MKEMLICVQTGEQTIAPSILQGGKADSIAFTPVTWRVTVYQPQPRGNDTSRTDLSLWFDTNGANYTDNFALGWDACYLWMVPWALNTFRRGQNDSGDCSTTLNQACVSDLQAATNSAAKLLVSQPTTPGPNSSNLTTNSLPGVCSQIAAMVSQQFPESCAPFFNGPGVLTGGPPALGGALTGPKSLIAASQCTTKYGSLIWNQFGTADQATYELGNWWVTGLLTVYLPIADYARPVTLPSPTTIATCLRASNISAGSYVPPDAPAPEDIPVSSSNAGSNSTFMANTVRSPSGGGIAGIAIGIIIGILGVAIAVLLIRRHRLKQRRDSTTGTARTDSSEMEGKSTLLQSAPAEAPNMNAFYEMSSPQYAAELQDKSFQAPVELPVSAEHCDLPTDPKALSGRLGRSHPATRR
jgi:hypothetical protein